MKLPWFKFFTQDWKGDSKLSLCTPATRGIFIDLICDMHGSDRSGELRGTAEQLSRAARCSTVEVIQALTDLKTTEAADVEERNGTYQIRNRRMYREFLDRKSAADRQKEHREKHRNANVTGESLGRDQKSEVRGQIESTRVLSVKPPPELETPAFAAAWESWMAYRREARLKAYTEVGTKAQFKRLARDMGHDRAINAIENSIAQGFQGIYEGDRPGGKPRGAQGSNASSGRGGAPGGDREVRRAGRC